MSLVEITSFGHGHPLGRPEADVLIDARHLFRTPHHDPAMVNLTGLDQVVYAHVMDTPGVRTMVAGTAATLLDMVGDLPNMRIRVAVGCGGGRHRAVAIARALAELLTIGRVAVSLTHRDVHLPVLAPTTPSGGSR